MTIFLSLVGINLVAWIICDVVEAKLVDKD